MESLGQQMGLPCSHILRQKIADGQMIELRDIQRQWYIWSDNGNDLHAREDLMRYTQDFALALIAALTFDDMIPEPRVNVHMMRYASFVLFVHLHPRQA